MDYTMIRPEDLDLMGYGYVISIDPESGYGSCILPLESYPSHWDPSNFPYDEAMSEVIAERITEEDILSTIEKMRLSTVLDALSKQDNYKVYYSCIGENGSIVYKKATFIRRKNGDILLFLLDNNDETLALRQANIQLQDERNKAIQEFNIANRMLHVLDRDFRIHLFSLSGLTDMMMEENTENEKDSPHYHRADKLIEQTYLTGSMMLESLNDMRELKNLIRWDEILQDDLISIEDMLRYFDEPLQEHCEFQNTIYTWDVSGVKHMDIIADETILSSLLLRLIRYIITNSYSGGYLQVQVNENDDEDDSSIYTFTITSDHCNLSNKQLKECTMSYQGLFKELQKNLNAIDFNLLLLKKYAELLNGSYEIPEVKEKKQINLSFRFRRGEAFMDGAQEKTHNFESTLIQELDTRINRPSSSKENEKVKINTDLFSGKTALVIDDNLINLEVTSRLLRNAGFFVVDVENGQQGIDAFIRDQGRFDLIILDIRMPGITGIEVAKMIRASGEQGANVPIIALTANDRPEERQQSIDAGMNDYLAKPVNPYILYNIIEKYVK